MFLKMQSNDDLVEVLDLNQLFDPFEAQLNGRYQRGEEMPDEEEFKKTDLVFPSGESLPRCWIDPHYKDK